MNIIPVVNAMVQRAGHTVVYTPPHHSNLQSIETVWANVKGYVGRRYVKDKTTFKDVLPGLESASQSLTSSSIYGCVRNSGRKKKRTTEQITEVVKLVALEDRQTTRTMAEQSHIPKTTLIRFMKQEKSLKAKSSHTKPYLSDANKIQRVKHALSFLRPSSRSNHIFSSMYNVVHVDEKWFYVTKVKKRFYVFADEVLPKQSSKSKHFVTKVMFLAAVCRPHYDHNKECIFDGKLGVWPFVEKVVAKRASKNRTKGTVLTQPQTVTSDVYKNMIMSKVIPAIQTKIPRGAISGAIFLQQDNASPHRRVTTKLLVENGISGIEATSQPPNSPDFNVLDLGFFNSIQSLQIRKRTRTIDELIDAVESSFNELPSSTVSKTFITLQKVMEKALEAKGGNDFQLPHMKKDASIKDLSTFNVICDPVILESARMHLDGVESP
ncbi:hypothetical protein AeRB84_019745 [Aphanomyces euteiches]|nr:hypothetical protein AeRB84_019745 [Aphanomyces euteiches]